VWKTFELYVKEQLEQVPKKVGLQSGPYLRGGGSGSNPSVGPIMLILTHYFNDNLRLKYPTPPQQILNTALPTMQCLPIPEYVQYIPIPEYVQYSPVPEYIQ